MFSITKKCRCPVTIGVLITSVLAISFSDAIYIKYNKEECAEIQFDNEVEKELANTRTLILDGIKYARDNIQDHVRLKNNAREVVGKANVMGAISGIIKYFYHVPREAFSQICLTLSQILQGYGYAGYQYYQITEDPNLQCGVQDFRRVSLESELEFSKCNSFQRLKTINRQRLGKYREALWCILRFKDDVKNYKPIVEAELLDEALVEHYETNKLWIEQMEEEQSDKIALKTLKKDEMNLRINARKLKHNLKILTNDAVKKSAELREGEQTVLYGFGRSIISGSLLEIVGLSIANNKTLTSPGTTQDIAEYSFLGFYGLGFGWPSILEGREEFRAVCLGDVADIFDDFLTNHSTNQSAEELLKAYPSKRTKFEIDRYARKLKGIVTCLMNNEKQIKTASMVFEHIDQLHYNMDQQYAVQRGLQNK